MWAHGGWKPRVQRDLRDHGEVKLERLKFALFAALEDQSEFPFISKPMTLDKRPLVY